MLTVGCACKIASSNGITCSLVSESNFFETLSIIICFCDIGSVETFSTRVSCTIWPLSTSCVITNSFVADNMMYMLVDDLSLLYCKI